MTLQTLDSLKPVVLTDNWRLVGLPTATESREGGRYRAERECCFPLVNKRVICATSLLATKPKRVVLAHACLRR